MLFFTSSITDFYIFYIDKSMLKLQFKKICKIFGNDYIVITENYIKMKIIIIANKIENIIMNLELADLSVMLILLFN